MKKIKEKITNFIVEIIYLSPLILALILIIFSIYGMFKILTSDLPFWMKWALLTHGGN